jgi:diguanylate cyclase (GGDEF)-like protein/PAS domain S-box-containing protein
MSRSYTRIVAGTLVLIGCGIAVETPGALANITSQDYLPHGFCFLWNVRLLTLHVVSDSIIFLSYMAISITLAWFVYCERKRIPLGWIVGAFGAFIVACGFTHAMDVLVLWKPLYWLSGDVKLVTAIASLTTAAFLPFVISTMRELLERARTSQRNESRFLAASDSSSDAFFILQSVRDPGNEITDFRFSFLNANGARLVSSTRERVQGRRLLGLFKGSTRAERLFESFKRVVETGDPIDAEVPIESSAALTASWIHYHILKLEDGVAVTATDISVRKESELKLAQFANFARSIVASSPLATIVTDATGTITSINAAAERMLLYTESELIGLETPLIFFNPEELVRRAEKLTEELRAPIEPGIAVLAANPSRGLSEEAEWRFVRRDGSQFDALLNVSALSDAGGADGLVLVAYDITERKRNEERIAHLAHHDALTGLPARVLLYERLAESLARADREKRNVAVLMVDLDGFKKINDRLGHQAGDEILIEVAKRLQSTVGPSDTVARIGGDEFIVVLDEVQAAHDAAAAAAALIQALEEPIELGAEAIRGSASIGVCLYPDDGQTAKQLLMNADAAMYRSKAAGRGGFKFFAVNLQAGTMR